MEQEVIQKNNVLIAKFMGATVDKYGEWKIPNVSIPYQGFEQYGDGEPCLKFTDECRDYEMQYHKSWDWIMPVIENINSTHNKNTSNGSIIVARDLQYTIQHLLVGGYGFTENKRETVFLTLENLWERVVLFIKWYNKNK
ncbi:MAG: hypothetical protein IPJ01_10190 [Micavibrio sp.]|nr:hypothetical protein [Micavibrio sp.]